jgi:predicted ArsR family transcriptional regulator
MELADTCRERVRAALTAATGPLTAVDLANQVDTPPIQARRALRQLEQQGAAVRRLAPAGGRYLWHATR